MLTTQDHLVSPLSLHSLYYREFLSPSVTNPIAVSRDHDIIALSVVKYFIMQRTSHVHAVAMECYNSSDT